jgi:hypothetical protein
MRINFSELGNAILLEILNRAIETKHNVAAGLHLWFQLLSIVCSKKSRFHVHVVHSFGIPMLYCTAHACTALSAKSASNPPRSSESCHAQPTNVIPRIATKLTDDDTGGKLAAKLYTMSTGETMSYVYTIGKPIHDFMNVSAHQWFNQFSEISLWWRCRLPSTDFNFIYQCRPLIVVQRFRLHSSMKVRN